MAENKQDKVYVGYTESPRVTQRVSLSLEDIEKMKQYATAKGKVHLDIVSIPDRDDNRKMRAFVSVYNPYAESEQQRNVNKQATDDVPF